MEAYDNKAREDKHVLVVTQPIGTNYGGILQAYALQRALRDLGLTPYTTSALSSKSKQFLRKSKHLRRLWNLIKGAKPALEPFAGRTSLTDCFVKEYVTQVPPEEAEAVARSASAVIVGSDQVWRKKFSPVKASFLTFVPDGVRKLSYAASFGHDNIDEYNLLDRMHAKRGIRRFVGVSVRESSGTRICAEDLDIEAVQHVDPTMLYSAEHYQPLIDGSNNTSSPSIVGYVLDPGVRYKVVSEQCEMLLGKPVLDFLHTPGGEQEVLPSVEEWLRQIADADLIITDSFHGVVFSIIFNTPFLGLGNQSRGNARFESLLSVVGLEDRLLNQDQEITAEILEAKIDWEAVNEIVAQEGSRARAYLRGCLLPS